jgi:hypothetical protein
MERIVKMKRDTYEKLENDGKNEKQEEDNYCERGTKNEVLMNAKDRKLDKRKKCEEDNKNRKHNKAKNEEEDDGTCRKMGDASLLSGVLYPLYGTKFTLYQ